MSTTPDQSNRAESDPWFWQSAFRFATVFMLLALISRCVPQKRYVATNPQAQNESTRSDSSGRKDQLTWFVPSSEGQPTGGIDGAGARNTPSDTVKATIKAPPVVFKTRLPTVPPLEVETAEHVDERLFLLNMLESWYDNWPLDTTDQTALATNLARQRSRANKLKLHIDDSRLDDDLSLLFDDYVKALDAYADFLQAIEAIDQQAIAQAAEDGFESGFAGGLAGGSVYAQMKNTDAPKSDAAGAAMIVGGVTYIFDAWLKSIERDRVKQQMVATEHRRVSDKISTALLRAQSIGKRMGTRHGWQRGEVGFEMESDFQEQHDRCLRNNNWQGLSQLFKEQVALRPRNPSVRLWRNLYSLFDPVIITPDTLLICGKDFRDCARLIPAPQMPSAAMSHRTTMRS